MVGIQSKNILTVLWRIIRTMQVICVLLYPGLLGRGIQSHIIDQKVSSRVPGEENSTQEVFFVALAKSAEVSQTESTNRKYQSVFTATSQDTLPGIVPSEASPQRQSALQRPRILPESHSNVPVTDKNEVEYFFEICKNYEKKSGKNLINVKGNLKKHSWYLKNVLHANDFVMNVINFGYRIPFVKDPTSVFLKNNRSALLHSDFVEDSITELLNKDCITEVKRPFVVNPLTVSVNSSGKKRLVLDLRHVNKFVDKQKVKFEGVKEAMTFINTSGYAFKFWVPSSGN